MFFLSNLIARQQQEEQQRQSQEGYDNVVVKDNKILQQPPPDQQQLVTASRQRNNHLSMGQSTTSRKRTRRTISTEPDEETRTKRIRGERHGQRTTLVIERNEKNDTDYDDGDSNGSNNAAGDDDDDDDDNAANEEDMDDRNDLLHSGPQFQNHYLFHENYSGIVKALYRGNTDQQQSNNKTNPHKDDTTTNDDKATLNVIHDALNAPTTRDLLREEDYNKNNDDDDDKFPVDKYDMVGRYEARKKTVYGLNPSTGRPTYRRKDISYRLETPEEIEERVRRIDRSMDRTLFAARWNRRKVNVQMEVDVGNAFATRAERYLKGTLQQDRKRRLREAKNAARKRNRRQQQEEEKAKSRRTSHDDHDGDDGLEEDGSLAEQNQLLARFTQHLEDEDKMKGQRSGRGPVPDMVSSSVPFRDQFDGYWEFGFSKPFKEDLQYNYNPTVEEMIQNSSQQAISDLQDNEERRRERNNSTVGFRALIPTERSGTFVYFPPNTTRVTNANSTYRPGYMMGHIRQLMAMAARSLCGGPLPPGCVNDNSILENRYLRLLCVQSRMVDKGSRTEEGLTLATFRNQHFNHMLAEESGRDMLLYAQNIWNNPVDAAVRLGLVTCEHDIPVAGNMLSRIKSTSTTNRTKVSRQYRKAPHAWTHNSTSIMDAEDTVDDIDDHGNGSSELFLGDGLLDVVSSRGVRGSILKLSTDDPTEKVRRAYRGEEMPDSLLTPNGLYAHIPCTTPPAPNFPLDPPCTVFGPIDRYARYYHKSVRVDDQAAKLILSTLLARLAAQARGSKTVDGSRVHMNETQRQIEAFLIECTTVNENRLFKLYARSFPKSVIKTRDVPMVHVYHAVARYCSYVANTGLGVLSSSPDAIVKDEDPEEDIDEDGDEHPAKRLEHSKGECFLDLGPHKIAKQLSHFCWERIQRDSLLRFPRLRITAAVARICSNLPPSAAEILSRPLDDDFCRTPLDLFKQTLLHMEANGMISDSSAFDDRPSVHAAELEFTLHESAGVILEAVRIEPLNVEYLLWLVGCLASCLLVSSGNKIGSGAHLYPSQKVRSLMITTGLSHEVRVRLKKYSAVRMELAGSVRTLFTLAEHQRSSRAHFALVALLEWGEVITLLMDKSSLDVVQEIRKLHTFYVSQWLRQETSLFSLKYAERCKEHRDSCLRARQLENDPGDIRNWRRMVMSLGKLGSHSATSVRHIDQEHRTSCPECSLLSSQRWFDHDLISTEKAHETWWGNGREWWSSSLLNMVPLGIKKRETKGIKGTISCLYRPKPSEPIHRHVVPQSTASTTNSSLLNNQRRERKMAPKDLEPLRQEKQPQPVTASMMTSPERVVSHTPGVSSSYCSTKRLEWLATAQTFQSGDHSQYDLSDDIRSENYDKYMPMTYQDVMADSGTLQTEGINYNDNNGLATSPANVGDNIPLVVSCPSLEVMAYRIYIFCHLQSVAHPIVEEHIYALAAKCGNRTNTSSTTTSGNNHRMMENHCDEFRILQWFMSLGMNIEATLIKKSPKTRK